MKSGQKNAVTYLCWHGDVPFSVAPLCDMDAVVLCRLCYFDLSNVPEASGQTGIPLDECLKTYGDAIHPKGANGVGSDFFQEVSKTRCFGKAVARRYVDAHPDKDGTQFSATEYVLPKGPVFVSFRGTDGTMLGWREEFVDDLFNAIERAGSMTAQIADSVPDAFSKILAEVVGARPGSKVTAAKIPFRVFAGHAVRQVRNTPRSVGLWTTSWPIALSLPQEDCSLCSSTPSPFPWHCWLPCLRQSWC